MTKATGFFGDYTDGGSGEQSSSFYGTDKEYSEAAALSAAAAAASATEAAASEAGVEADATAAEAAKLAAQAAQAAAETAETNAESSETAAASSATSAAGSATTATTKASEASSSATAAASSATTATTQAGNASTSASNAADSATAASTSASSAATSATSAATSAGTATTKATAASASATAAASSASSASSSATAASSSATAAQTAQTAAEAAQTAAEAAEVEVAADASFAAASASAAAASETNAATSASAALASETNASASETASAASASAASTSETNAAASASAASTSATQASDSATAASGSATNASASATAALNSQTAAEAAEAGVAADASAAAASASAASASESNAAASASAASTSETNAATSESNAATSATAASGSATAAASSASAASTSASNAATSASNASSSETAASASETAAASSATSASTSATNAATSATNASNSASAASTSASNASTSESNAATSASNASTSESNASSSATAAAGSATAAAGSASAASASADAALSALDNFDDRYLGQKATAPTVDNDGDALVTGALYFDTTDDAMKVWDGTQWLAAYASLSGALIAVNNLSDLSDAGAARTNLGLGTAATTNSTAYATAAQGTLADSALQSGDNISLLTNNSGYITGNQTITLSGDVSGSGTTSIAVTIADDSHNHIIANVDGLQTALDGKAAVSTLSNYLPLSGGTLTGNLSLGDNNKLRLGAGNDLEIYHNGTESIIADAGTGILKYTSVNDATAGVVFEIENTSTDSLSGSFVSFTNQGTTNAAKIGSIGDQFYVLDSANNTYITASSAGVVLQHGGSTKLQTTLSGATVTGTLYATTAVSADGHGNSQNWYDAYTWGNHASAGYLTSIASNSIGADELDVAGNGTAGYALTSDGDGSFSWTALASGGLGNVVEDTTPQLGGNLDTNGNDIAFGDNDKATFGASNDLQLFHNGSHSYLQDNGTGNLFIQGQQTVISGYSSGNWNALFVDNGDSIFYHSTNGEKARVNSTGIHVTGTITASENITATGYLQATSYLYTRDNLRVINNAGTGWNTWATWVDGAYQLNVDTITATGGDSINWNTAYGWGNHASAGYLASSSYTASDVLTKIKTVDGSGSGLDADLLDGQHASAFQPAGTYNTVIGTDTDLDTSGSTIIDNIYVTDGVITSMGTRTLTAADIGAITGNQTITLTGDVSGSGTTSISVTVADDSHNHIISNVDGLQTALDGKLSTSGKAADSNLLDGIDSGSFLRSDAADQKTSGTLRFNDNVLLTFGTGDDAEFFCDGSHFYLDLNSGIGNFYIRDGSTTRFTFDDAGSFTATGNVTAYSDRRLKDDIQKIKGAVEKVQQLSGNTYTRNDLPDTERRYAGVIAQEVEAVLPEAVSEAEDGTKTVDYNATIALLIEAVKELKAEVDELKGAK